MQIFRQNIINLYGSNGRTWLKDIPNIVSQLVKTWNLTNIKPVSNLSWNYVALGTQGANKQVVLKISYDNKSISTEYLTLKAFNGHGSIRALDFNPEYNAMLLEQAIPGYTLKSAELKLQDKINIYAQIVEELRTASVSNNHTYSHVSTWLDAIERIKSSYIKENWITLAKRLKMEMLSSAQDETLFHGDLHLENILASNRGWLAIDPKGIICEKAFEVTAFGLISKQEISNSNVPDIILERTTLLAKATHLNIDRLLNWLFLRVIISAQWFIEDGGDPSFMVRLANYIYQVLESRNKNLKTE